jgi:hypothetical protein
MSVHPMSEIYGSDYPIGSSILENEVFINLRNNHIKCKYFDVSDSIKSQNKNIRNKNIMHFRYGSLFVKTLDISKLGPVCVEMGYYEDYAVDDVRLNLYQYFNNHLFFTEHDKRYINVSYGIKIDGDIFDKYIITDLPDSLSNAMNNLKQIQKLAKKNPEALDMQMCIPFDNGHRRLNTIKEKCKNFKRKQELFLYDLKTLYNSRKY